MLLAVASTTEASSYSIFRSVFFLFFLSRSNFRLQLFAFLFFAVSFLHLSICNFSLLLFVIFTGTSVEKKRMMTRMIFASLLLKDRHSSSHNERGKEEARYYTLKERFPRHAHTEAQTF